MRRRIKGFTLIELLVVIAIIALLISILLPSLSRARELSKRLVCGSNTKGIGTSAKIYSNDNAEKWMAVGFKRGLIDNGGVDYVNASAIETNISEPGTVGWERSLQSTSDTANLPNVGSTTLSVTRAYWMLVRSGDITVKQFICPSSSDVDDTTENLELYYDFVRWDNISYGYQVPFGPRDTTAREGMDNRQVIAADKSPYYAELPDLGWDSAGPGDTPLEVDHSPKQWRKFNSNNHGGKNNGEGQNCLFGDGHVNFEKLPAVGIDADNIFTLMTNDWSENTNRIWGDTVHTSQEDNPYPGQDALAQGAGGYSSTDSLIYP